MTMNDTESLQRRIALVERIEILCAALDANYLAQYPDGVIEPTRFSIDQSFQGRRFIRIVATRGGTARSVHAFVEIATGDLMKAAGFKAPAKQARGNLLDDADFARILAACDWAGGYLYLR